MGTLAFDLILWPPLLTIVGTDLRLSSAQLLAKPYVRAGWGFPGCITRTPIYWHFNSVDEIYRQIAIRFVQQTGVDVERYVRRRKPTSLEELVTLMIKAIQNYFNQPNPAKPGALARHIPFESRHLVQDFDKVAALPYHTLWHAGWAVEPLSEEYPFRTLVITQSAIFKASIQRNGKITDLAVKQRRKLRSIS